MTDRRNSDGANVIARGQVGPFADGLPLDVVIVDDTVNAAASGEKRVNMSPKTHADAKA